MKKSDKFCMLFTNEEIIEYLVKPLNVESKLIIRMANSEDNEIFENIDEKICYVSFDGEKENFHISFYGHQTSIFISDEEKAPERKFTFNMEFMFIDDIEKQYYTSSDTGGNVVYEGSLRDKTHKEILQLFYEFIMLLAGTTKMTVEENKVSQENGRYPKCNYIVRICNECSMKKSIKFDNILFITNE